MLKEILVLLLDIIHLPLYFISFFIPKDRNLWIFGGWFGEKYLENSRYLFEYVKQCHPEVRAVWLAKKAEVISEVLRKGYEACPVWSLKGYWLSMRAKVAVFSQSKLTDINYRVFSWRGLEVQLWHGTPIKRIHYDDLRLYPANYFKFRFPVKQLLKRVLVPFRIENYALVAAPSEETRRKFASAFRCDERKIRVTGSPRNDVVVRGGGKGRKGGKIRGIYMPTFRGGPGEQTDLFYRFGFRVEEMESFLKNHNMTLDLKLHPVNFPEERLLKDIKGSVTMKFLEIADIYEKLGDYDFMISDFSGAYLDYLLLNRPVIFASFDLSTYLAKDRKLYYDYDEVTPGPKASGWQEVLKCMDDIAKGNDPYQKERERVRDLFNAFVDDRNSERVFHEITRLLN